MHVCIYVCMCVCMRVSMFVCMFVCLSAYMYACMCFSMSPCMFVCSCVCIYVCVYVYVFICLYTCLFAPLFHWLDVYLTLRLSLYICPSSPSACMSLRLSDLSVVLSPWRSVYMHVCMYVSHALCVYLPVCMYVYLYVCGGSPKSRHFSICQIVRHCRHDAGLHRAYRVRPIHTNRHRDLTLPPAHLVRPTLPWHSRGIDVA